MSLQPKTTHFYAIVNKNMCLSQKFANTRSTKPLSGCDTPESKCRRLFWAMCSLCNSNQLMLHSMRKIKQTGRLRPCLPSSCLACPTQSDMPTRICPPAHSAQFCLTFSSLPCSVKICPVAHGKARMQVWTTDQWTSDGQEKDWRRNSHMISAQSNNF